jgi:DNA invertase Pin-like site-specific DNA recombinase
MAINHRNLKVYDYVIRVSALGDRDADATLTIPEQEARCLAEIERIGGRVGIKLDAIDVSGGVVIDSPAYQRGLRRVQGGETAGVVVAYSSRFARNAWAVGRYLEQLKKANGELWFADRPGIDYRTPSGAIIFSVDAVMNDNYLQECKTKAESTLRENVLVRGIPSKVPFGYRRNGDHDPQRDPKALTPDPETAPTVKLIFRARADGRSWVDIAGEAGLSVPTVRGIIRNESYLGVVQCKRREYRKGVQTGEVIRKDGCHEPLVNAHLWKAAQSSRTVQRSGVYAAGVAGGLLTCGSCGGRLAVAGSSDHLTYGCRRERNGGKCSAPVFVLKDRADEFVTRFVLAALADIAPARGDDGHLARLEEVRDQARQQLDTALERSLMLSDPQKAQSLLSRTEATLDDAQNALDDAVNQAQTVSDLLPAAGCWGELSIDEQRRVAGLVIESITVGPRADLVEDRFTVEPR